MSRDVRATIHVAALRENLARVRQLAPRSQLMAVVKADGYGHGLERVAQALRAADAFGVASIADGLRIRAGGLDIHAGAVIGVCAESHCKYLDSLAFPDTVDAGLRVARIGRSSVRYEIGLFRAGSDAPAADGWFVHVFVDRATRRPVELPAPLRAALERLLVPQAATP